MILAIDDDAGRYQNFKNLLALRTNPVPFEVATCPGCVNRFLPEATHIFLDYDLDGYQECASCLIESTVNLKGSYYLPHLNELGRPVIVSSCSQDSNRYYLYDNLTVKKKICIPAWELNVEYKWLGWLWAYGEL
jgi:hypothetical protein